MIDFQLIHNERESRYEFHVEEFTPHIEYEIKEDKIYLTHTRVPEELKGQGIARKLVLAVFEELSDSDYKIVPVCDYIKAFVDKHPEWKARI
jgi:predicted GNAT family acetyltransferase